LGKKLLEVELWNPFGETYYSGISWFTFN
jgi:hypothetical protein